MAATSGVDLHGISDLRWTYDGVMRRVEKRIAKYEVCNIWRTTPSVRVDTVRLDSSIPSIISQRKSFHAVQDYLVIPHARILEYMTMESSTMMQWRIHRTFKPKARRLSNLIQRLWHRV